MTIGFLRPVGPVADVNELEYISAIAQTDLKSVRSNGSITAEDIMYFMLSRYGIVIGQDEVKSKIIRGLGGGDEEEDDTIDLMEVVATLLIPTLLKASMDEVPEGVVKPHEELVQFVLSMILHDTADNQESPQLTTDLIKTILISYGESELAKNDELIEEMLEAATSKGAEVLDQNAFKVALTADVTLYDPKCESRLTSNMEDVFLKDRTQDLESNQEIAMTDEEYEERMAAADTLKRKKVLFSAFDTTAGAYRSKAMIVLLWTLFICVFLGFVRSAEGDCSGHPYSRDWSGQPSALMICQVTSSILLWLINFLVSSIYGLILVGLGSTGNTTDTRSFCVPLVGAIVTLVVIFSDIITRAIAGSEQLQLSAELQYLGAVLYFIAALIIAIHLMHSLAMVLPRQWIKQNHLLDRILSSSYLRNESNLKKAAAFKMNKMVDNAIELAKKKEDGSVLVTHFGQGLLNFSKERRVEWSSGMFETIKKMYTGELFSKEGIWLSARLLSSNIGQFIVVIYLLIGGVRLTGSTYETYSKAAAKDALQEYTDYFFSFVAEDDQVAALVTNTSAFFSEFLATAVSSDVVAAQCENYSASLFDLGESLCNHTTDFYPSCGELESVTDYFCSLSRTYSDFLANATNDTTTVGETGGCCAWGGQCLDLEDDPSGGWCSESRTNCEEYCDDGTYVAVSSYLDAPIFGALGDEEGARTNLGLLDASGLDVRSLIEVARDALVEAGEAAIDALYPAEDWMLFIPLIFGVVAGTLSAISLAVTYVPSVTSTTLKLRSGVIPSLRDVEFNQYRTSADQVTIIIGSLVWGCLLSSVLVGGLVGVGIFLFLWQATVPIVQRILAIVIGVVVVVIIKLVLVSMCRCAFYKAFYRKQPAGVNLSSLALESANFALSASFVLLRMIKLLVTASLYVGRIDTWFLAPGVGKYKTFELDNYPRIFLKDILAHEAHRHPYLDLLGAVYLMKLRYAENFGKRCGATWRLIFVYALMPWMHKYRILVPLEDQVDEVAAALGADKRKGSRKSTSGFLRGDKAAVTEVVQPEPEKAVPSKSLMDAGKLHRRATQEKKVEQDNLAKLQMQNSILEDENASLRQQIAELKGQLG